MVKLLQLEMILSILIVELELGATLFHQGMFGGIELGDGLETVRTVIVGAFVNGYFFFIFPAKERQPAMRAEELGLPVVPETVLDLEKMAADLAPDL